MIAINDYRQFIAELVAAAAAQCEEEAPRIRLAVTESQLINMLKDMAGIVVAGNIPGADISNNGYYMSDGECIIYVIEKWTADRQGGQWEYDEFARIQRLMAAIVRLLTGEDFQEFCDHGELDTSRPLTIEWEYNEFGGFNGQSISFRLKDRNGTGL
jgi:hypothetical protein